MIMIYHFVSLVKIFMEGYFMGCFYINSPVPRNRNGAVLNGLCEDYSEP